MAERKIWTAADYVRTDWSTEELADRLERWAHGYNGLLRQLLCTAATQLRLATHFEIPKASVETAQKKRVVKSAKKCGSVSLATVRKAVRSVKAAKADNTEIGK